MSATALIIAVLLLAGNAFFVGAEFAVISVRRSQIEPMAESSRRARTVLYGLRHLSLMLAAAQLGITLCSLGLGAVAEPAVAHLLEGLFEALSVPAALLQPIAFAVALTLVVFLHMVLGEMVPKNISIASPEQASLVLVPPLAAFARLAGPVIRVLNHLANAFLHRVGVEPADELSSSYSPEQLADIIAESRQYGLLEETEHERLASTLALAEVTARDVMVALPDVVTLTEASTADELEQLVGLTGYSRFPVRQGDRLIGFVHVKDILALPDEARTEPLDPALRREMPDLPAGAPLEDVLELLQGSASHLAQVHGDDGSVLGVLAMEDVVEFFVGEVEDATSPVHAPALR